MLLLAILCRFCLNLGVLTAAGIPLAQASHGNTGGGVVLVSRIRMAASALAALSAMASVIILMLRLGAGLNAEIASLVLTSPPGIAAGLIIISAPMTASRIRNLQLAGSYLMALAFAISGHAPARSFLDGVVVALHVFAASWWTGGLILLLLTGGKLSATVRLLSSFSRIARLAIVTLIGAGALTTLLLMRGAVDAAASPYVRIFLTKFALVIIVLSIALYNRVRLTPDIAYGNHAASRTLNRTVIAELLLIAAIAGVTAILTSTASPPSSMEHEHYHSVASPSAGHMSNHGAAHDH